MDWIACGLTRPPRDVMRRRGAAERPICRLRLTLLLCCCLHCGCHVTGSPRDRIAGAYDVGDTEAAQEHLRVLTEQSDAEQDIIALDQAVIELMSGRPGDTVRTLETARHRLEYLQQTDIREQTAAALKDDSRIAWSGREFERRMLDNLQVVAGLLQNSDDAFSMATRGMALVEQDRLGRLPQGPDPPSDPEDTPGSERLPAPPRYAANRMTAWLAAAIRSENIRNADATDLLIQQVAFWDPSGDRKKEFVRTLGTSASRDSGTLQVLVLSGRITPWESERAMPTTAALLAADRILSATSDHTLPPSTSPVLVSRPCLDQYPQNYQTRVAVAGHPVRTSQLLVDLNAAAWDSWQADRDQQLARAVVRRVVKKGAVYGAKNALNVQKGSAPDLLLNVAGVIWEAREQADLRQWHLLPAAVELVQMELPAGEHRVTLQVCPAEANDSSPVLDQLEIPVAIEDGRNTYVVCFRPQQKLLGVQSSGAADSTGHSDSEPKL